MQLKLREAFMEENIFNLYNREYTKKEAKERFATFCENCVWYHYSCTIGHRTKTIMVDGTSKTVRKINGCEDYN
jgi:hypothetical protein